MRQNESINRHNIISIGYLSSTFLTLLHIVVGITNRYHKMFIVTSYIIL